MIRRLGIKDPRVLSTSMMAILSLKTQEHTEEMERKQVAGNGGGGLETLAFKHDSH